MTECTDDWRVIIEGSVLESFFAQENMSEGEVLIDAVDPIYFLDTKTLGSDGFVAAHHMYSPNTEATCMSPRRPLRRYKKRI
jgi:hypothetical protein